MLSRVKQVSENNHPSFAIKVSVVFRSLCLEQSRNEIICPESHSNLELAVRASPGLLPDAVSVNYDLDLTPS